MTERTRAVEALFHREKATLAGAATLTGAGARVVAFRPAPQILDEVTHQDRSLFERLNDAAGGDGGADDAFTDSLTGTFHGSFEGLYPDEGAWLHVLRTWAEANLDPSRGSAATPAALSPASSVT